MKHTLEIALAILMASFPLLHSEESRQVSVEQFVAKTHAASLKLREAALRRTIAKDTCWPGGVWGDNLWCLAALYLNEKTDMANERLLKQAKEFIASKPAQSRSAEGGTGLKLVAASLRNRVRNGE